MFDDFVDWLVSILPTEYAVSVGMWQDTPQLEFVAAVRQAPAGAPVVDTRTARYEVTLVGPRNRRDQQGKILADAAALVATAIARETMPCGAAHVRSMGEPMGPGLTTENRAWARLTFEVIF